MKKIMLLILFLMVCIGFAQTNTTGQVVLSTTTGLEMDVQLDVTASEVTITINGPADRWLAIGFDVTSMTNGEDVLVYIGGSPTDTAGTLQDRTFIGVGAVPTAGISQDWTLVTNDITTEAGKRTIIATRALNTADANDHVFSLSDTSINLVWARGPDLVFTNHGNANRGIVPAVGYTLGVEEFALSNSKLYPNPVSTDLEIDLPNSIINADVEVYNVLGKLIHKDELSELNSTINVSDWNSGVYLVRVISDNISHTKRIIKQ